MRIEVSPLKGKNFGEVEELLLRKGFSLAKDAKLIVVDPNSSFHYLMYSGGFSYLLKSVQLERFESSVRIFFVLRRAVVYGAIFCFIAMILLAVLDGALKLNELPLVLMFAVFAFPIMFAIVFYSLAARFKRELLET